MTSLPAARFGLAQRGCIRKGYHADLVALDAGRLADRADYGHPHQLSEGIRCVIVNGQVTLRAGRLEGRRSGAFV
jgi:N-acyl-D-amino-acid deacylase